MNLKLDKKLVVKAGYLLLLLLVAPFAVEFILIAEFVGVEFAATFMLMYFRTAVAEALQRWRGFRMRLNEQYLWLLGTAMFQPRGYGVAASTSCAIIVFSCSTALACSVWLPLMLMSTGGLGS